MGGGSPGRPEKGLPQRHREHGDTRREAEQRKKDKKKENKKEQEEEYHRLHRFRDYTDSEQGRPDEWGPAASIAARPLPPRNRLCPRQAPLSLSALSPL
jgi:hypothetical protein